MRTAAWAVPTPKDRRGGFPAEGPEPVVRMAAGQAVAVGRCPQGQLVA